MLFVKIFTIIFLIIFIIYFTKLNDMISKYPLLRRAPRFENRVFNFIYDTISRIIFAIMALIIFLDIIGLVNFLPD